MAVGFFAAIPPYLLVMWLLRRNRPDIVMTEGRKWLLLGSIAVVFAFLLAIRVAIHGSVFG